MSFYTRLALAVFLLSFAGAMQCAALKHAPKLPRFVPPEAEHQGPGYLCRRAEDGALECIDLDTFLALQKEPEKTGYHGHEL